MRSKAREEVAEDDEPDQTAELIDEFKAKRRAMYEQDEEEHIPAEEVEDQVEKDIRERDEFAERLAAKDAEKTSGNSKPSKREREEEEKAESRKRLANDGDARKKALPDMRDKSRQEYLIKRGAQQVELLRREVEDERSMFNRDELSARERRELEYKEQILRITDERSQIRDKVEGYQVHSFFNNSCLMNISMNEGKSIERRRLPR
jgi:pre-mRNA-splicing factor ATP-dependent RNA helicase DHX16